MAKSKWPDVRSKLKLVEKWALDGLTEKQIANNLGISHETMNQYKKLHTDFSEVIKKGREVMVLEIENALFKRAKGYEYEEKKVYTKTEDGVSTTYTEITKKHQPPDVGAAIFILKNKDKENYSDNPQMIELKKQEMELRQKIAENGEW